MLIPKTETELARMVGEASGALAIEGGETRPIGRPVRAEVLSTSRLRGIELYEPGALTLVARAGTPVSDIKAALAAEGQRLAFEPMDHRGLLGTQGAPTIGGVVAGNVSGPRRIQVGAARDFLLGVRFVDGLGRVLKNGGRVMKNVTGYDLVKLMAGSWGTLGVLSEVSLKVLPVPQRAGTVLIDALSVDEAVRAMSAAMGSPFEVTGAAHIVGKNRDPVTMLRVEGFADSVAYRLGELRALLGRFGSNRVDSEPDSVARTWADVRDVAAFHGRAGDIWRFSVKPTDAPSLLGALGTDQAVLDWAGGLVWVLAPEGRDMRALMGDIPGHATLVRASDETRAAVPVFHPEPAPIAAISAGLRARFDPRGILNPGRMG